MSVEEEEEEFEEVSADDGDDVEDEYYEEEVEILSESGHLPPPNSQQQMDDPEGVYEEEYYSTDADGDFLDDEEETQSEEASLSRHSGSRSSSFRSGESSSSVTKSNTYRTDYTPSSRRSVTEGGDESSNFHQASFRSETTSSSRAPTSARPNDVEEEDEEEENPSSRQDSFVSHSSASSSRTPTSYSGRTETENDTEFNSESRTTSIVSQSSATSASSRRSASPSSSRRSYTDTNHSNRSGSASSSRRSYTDTHHSQRSVTSHSRMNSIREDETQESSRQGEMEPVDASPGRKSLHLPDPSSHSPIPVGSVSTCFRTKEMDRLGSISNHSDDESSRSRSGTSRSSSVSQDHSKTTNRSGSLSNRISESRRSNVDKSESFSSRTGSRSRRTSNSQRSGIGASNRMSPRSIEQEMSGRSSGASVSSKTADEFSHSGKSESSRSSETSESSRQGKLPSRPSLDGQNLSSPVSHRSAASSVTPATLTRPDASSRRIRLVDDSSQIDDASKSTCGAASTQVEKSDRTSTSSRKSIPDAKRRPQQLVEALYPTNGEYSHHDGASGTQSIAILGTMSDAGKSVLAAAICRILVNGGTRVAPFKAQNMSNNASPALLPDPKRREALYKSFEQATKHKLTTTTLVTKEGYGEIGTAQSLQAEACKIVPRVEMNPVLLKSGGKNEKGEYLCAVVVLGKQIVRETYGELQRRTSSLRSMVLESHHALAEATGAEVIVIEGAGSCTELNLMERDIVNLPLVRSLSCPWLLVANIDCGGVFAQIVGTKMCVPERDWDLCVGVIVNKLRGEAKYFEPGPVMLERMVGKPIFVVPFLDGLNLPEEDGLGIERRLAWEKDELPKKENKDGKPVVVVVAYPHTAIADDLCPLEQDERFQVEWRRQRIPKPFPWTTAVVLPGSRLTMMDLKWLIDSGWADFIRKHRAAGGTVVGICGGYQMLGRTLHDPEGVEGIGGSRQGIGLLPISTTIAPVECKVVKPRKGQLYPSGIQVEGFELHCGVSEVISEQVKLLGRTSGISPLLAFENGKPEGMRLGTVYGTYLHGLFRSEKARVELLVSNKEDFPSMKHSKASEDPIDRFASHVASCGLTCERLRNMIYLKDNNNNSSEN